jgi:hypothetical protein
MNLENRRGDRLSLQSYHQTQYSIHNIYDSIIIMMKMHRDRVVKVIKNVKKGKNPKNPCNVIHMSHTCQRFPTKI